MAWTFIPIRYYSLKTMKRKDYIRKSIVSYLENRPGEDALHTLRTFQKFLKQSGALSFLTRHRYFLMLESGKAYPANFNISFSNTASTALIYYVPLKTWVLLTSCTGGWFRSGFITKEFSSLDLKIPISVFLLPNKKMWTSFTIQ